MMKTYKIYPNVKIGKQAVIEDFVIIGIPPKGKKPGEVETIIGDRAIIRSHSVIYAGNVIGDDFQTGHHVFIREYNNIGNNVSIGFNTGIEHHCKIGNNVRIQGQSGIAEYSVIEEDGWLGPRVIFANVLHPLCPKAKECLKGPTVKRKAIIGASAILLPRVVIGENAFVGAGCMIRKDVPPRAVMYGNPPKVIANIFKLKCPFHLIDRPYQEEE